MFLTKDDLSSPSTIKQKEDETFDPWEQHGMWFQLKIYSKKTDKDDLLIGNILLHLFSILNFDNTGIL